MDFDEPRRRGPGEPFVPMINVVFLLLIFFLMTAQITPPPPFETEPPAAEGAGPPSGDVILHVSPEGAFGFADQKDDAAVRGALAAAEGDPLRLRADGGMEAATLAAALRRLSAAGVDRLELVTAPRADPAPGPIPGATVPPARSGQP